VQAPIPGDSPYGDSRSIGLVMVDLSKNFSSPKIERPWRKRMNTNFLSLLQARAPRAALFAVTFSALSAIASPAFAQDTCILFENKKVCGKLIL